jgi:zinc D-Ala-D-Ala carboxypeptidase
MSALSPNFQLSEFTDNKHGIANVPEEKHIKALILWCMNIGEPLREHFKKPVVITSGFRCEALNRAVGGATSSQHTKGEAADFHIPGVPNAEIWGYIKKNLNFDQVIAEQLKLEDDAAGWIHCSYISNGRKDAISYIGHGTYVRGLQFV